MQVDGGAYLKNFLVVVFCFAWDAYFKLGEDRGAYSSEAEAGGGGSAYLI